jgi:hypothetical protein
MLERAKKHTQGECWLKVRDEEREEERVDIHSPTTEG